MSASSDADADADDASTGSNARTDQVDALGFVIVVDGDGNGRVVGTLTNTADGSLALTGATVKSDGTRVHAAHLAEVIRLPPHEPVDLTEAPPVSVTAADLSVGSVVELTLDVTHGELLEMLVPVEPGKGRYSDVDVVPVPDRTPP